MNAAALTIAPPAQQHASNPRDVIDDALRRLAGPAVQNGLPAVHEDPAVLRDAHAVLMTSTCLDLAAAGHPGTVPSPAGDRARSEIIAYWRHRLAGVTQNLDDAIRAHITLTAAAA